AERYDLVNDVLSLGQDRLWRRFVAATVAAGPGGRVLDLAAGPGTASRTLTPTGAYCLACAFSLCLLPGRARRACIGGLRGGRAPAWRAGPGARAVRSRRRAPAAIPRPGLRCRHDLLWPA